MYDSFGDVKGSSLPLWDETRQNRRRSPDCREPVTSDDIVFGQQSKQQT